MSINSRLLFFTSPQTHPTRKLRNTVSLSLHQRRLYGKPRRYNTGKELDTETGLYYYGARYLDPKTSRWISGDPALGEYLPSAPVNDEAKKRNGNLPGMGGVFNYVNLHVYHYGGNNPVKLVDPDGREDDENQLTKDEMYVLFWRSREFNTMDEAAIDFAMNYNGNSIIMDREFSASIMQTQSGKFYYGVPRIGIREKAISYYGGNIVANIHTHGLSIGMELLPSKKDADNVVKYQTTSYIVNSLGYIMRLTPAGNDDPIFDLINTSAPNANTVTGWVGNFLVSQVVYDRILNKFLSIRGEG